MRVDDIVFSINVLFLVGLGVSPFFLKVVRVENIIQHFEQIFKMVAMTSRLNQGQCIGEFFKAEAGGRYFDHFENADRYISPTLARPIFSGIMSHKLAAPFDMGNRRG